MEQIIESRPSPIGVFADQQSAEAALQALREAGFSTEGMSLVPRPFDPNPPLKDTEAGRSAKGGAIVGSLMGAIVGLLLSNVNANPGLANLNPLMHLLGLVLAGSAVGAAGGSLIAATSGVSVHKSEAESKYAALEQNYLIMVDSAPDHLSEIAEILRQHGSSI